LETDDLLFLSKTRQPFLRLKAELEKLFDLTVCEGSVLKFLNLRIVTSPSGVSFDPTSHIQRTILSEYFKDIPSASIPGQLYPFPLDTSFEKRLYESPPLTGIDLTNATKKFRFAFSHIVGSLMHISTISRPDLAYCVMCYSGYMACPNQPIFDALHLTMCYLYHHPHLFPSCTHPKYINLLGNLYKHIGRLALQNTFQVTMVMALLPLPMPTLLVAYVPDALYPLIFIF
jgi:hypothetical protein